MLSVSRLTVHRGAFALRDIAFEIPRGGYGVLIGPAGAGKTTLLEAIAGLVPLDAGTVVLDGEPMVDTPPDRRPISLVYQHAYLFPHLTVRQNVDYGACRKTAGAEMSDRFGIAALGLRDVRTLSGGERQLVALARGLAREPKVLLLDEPFAALDPRSRQVARRALRALYLERRFTVLHVTHDFAEVGLLGDVAILLDGGRVLQAGPPDVVFPQTRFSIRGRFSRCGERLCWSRKATGPRRV